MKESRYITTTLPYVNDAPHVGFAFEIVLADVLARFWRAAGHDVFFTTGTDEHGQKIFQKAQESGQEVQAYVDHYAAEFGKLKGALNLSYDAFIRTTNEHHTKAAQELWKRCEAKGDIYKKTYKGLYCVGDEMFLRESDLVNGKCPNHPNVDPIEVEEENYFFRLSNYQEKLLAYLSDPSVVLPDWRREEAIHFVQNGLEDFSISREKARMSWGIPVPGDDSQVIYVWFDALTNYISTLGWPDGENFKKFWVDGHILQLAGKDQVRFQSLMWQAMLMSAGLPTTDMVVYHGFINSGGQKMSKSIGNVISPFDLVEKYGTDATRYLLLRHVHPFEDTDITWERLDEWYEAGLVNGLGNAVARVMKLAEEYLAKDSVPSDVLKKLEIHSEYARLIDQFKFNEALDTVWKGIQAIDERITVKKPFKLVRSDKAEEVQKGKQEIGELVVLLASLIPYLEFVMPGTVNKIDQAIRENKKPENLFPRLEK